MKRLLVKGIKERMACSDYMERTDSQWLKKSRNTTTKHQIGVATAVPVVLKPAPINLFPPPRVKMAKNRHLLVIIGVGFK